MKKIISLIIILFLFLGFSIKIVDAEYDSDYFIVTAYYSPLPNQEYYMMGDFESEKILQGNGTNGASGKEVFSGMLAAPKKYSFGTKIYLEGIGIGVVEDRGGAIVSAGKKGHKYDRIDVWMGYGDEGLRRALAWGKRTVKGNIVSNNSQITFNYKDKLAPHWAVRGLKSTRNRELVFDYDIGKKSPKEKVKNLQKFLKKIGVYKGKIDGDYMGETVDIIFDFQLANSIVSNDSDFGAGYWGTKTRAIFKKMYLNGEFEVRESIILEKKDDIEKTNKKSDFDLALEVLDNNLSKNIKEIEDRKDKKLFSSFNKRPEEIKKALEFMKKLKIYDGDLNLTYEDFIDVVFNFQVSNNIVKTQFDNGAGYFGPKTREKLRNLYFDYLNKHINQEKVDYGLEKEKLIQKFRKKELEKKYKELRLDALTKTAEKIRNIGVLKKGDTSQNVRELQNTLKELGFYDYKDTAIFGDITKKAVSDFQIKYDLIDNYDSKYAGILGERTLEKLGNILYVKYYKEGLNKLEKNDILVTSL